MSEKYWKACKKTAKRNVFVTGGIGGSEHTEFEIGKTYNVDGKPVLCDNGFHFFRAKDFVFWLDMFGEDTVFIEVEPLAEIVYDAQKRVCCKIKVVRYVPKKEWNGEIDTNRNSGNSNSGYRNSGNSNSGNWNSGDSNSGNSNSGNWNSGDSNSGYRNSGDRNSGNSNSGNWNSGDRNSGNRNSGNWNSGDYSGGFFNTKEPPLIMFDKPCVVRREDIHFPDYFYFDLEGGYKESWQRAFESASKDEVKQTIELPNFDYSVFEEITGVTKDMIREALK